MGLVGLEGSSASLQAGLEAQEGSEGTSPEVLEVNHLADPGVGRLVVPAGGHLVGLEDPKGDDPVVQVVDSHHLGQQEAALEEGGKSDRHGSLGRNKILG